MSSEKGNEKSHDQMTRSGLLCWLDDEVDELNSADSKASVLDEVVDVIYVARRYAFSHGITPAQLRDYASTKAAIRSSIGKNKDVELSLASMISERKY